MTFEEKTLSSEYVYKGKLIKVRREHVTTRAGTSTREIVDHPGGAVIAAVNDDETMVMVRQYRKAVGRVVLEAPAGKIDEGEEPEHAALRELKEETGYSAMNIRRLTRMYPSVGYSNEKLYIYLCTGLVSGKTDPDPGESIDVEEYTIDKLFNMVMDGEIEDAKTQVAVMMTKAVLMDKNL